MVDEAIKISSPSFTETVVKCPFRPRTHWTSFPRVTHCSDDQRSHSLVTCTLWLHLTSQKVTGHKNDWNLFQLIRTFIYLQTEAGTLLLQVCPVDLILVIELRGELLIIFAIRDLLKTDRMRGRETTDLLVKTQSFTVSVFVGPWKRGTELRTKKTKLHWLDDMVVVRRYFDMWRNGLVALATAAVGLEWEIGWWW